MQKEKIRFEIVRTNLENKGTISSVQKCYDLSRSQLITKNFKFALKNFIVQKHNLELSLLIIILTSFFVNFYSNISPFNSIKISTIVCLICFLTVVFLHFYFDWKNIIKDTISNLDLSLKMGNRVYGKENNGMFIATPSNSENLVIAMSCILIEEEKNLYRECSLPALSSDHSEGLITRVSVLPEYQGMGAGRAVVKCCIDFARNKKVKVVKLITTSSQEVAVSLYKSLGFKTTNIIESMSVFGFSKIIMELNLDQ